MKELRERGDHVRRLILDQGFDRVGFAVSGPAPDSQHFEAWIQKGYAADMDYLWRNQKRRLNPSEVVENAKSVIVVAVHYQGQSGLSELRNSEGKIATYAQGEDYHRVLERRLKKLRPTLTEAYPGHTFRYYVDTGPVLERSWAQKAGVGWVGKNTCSIDSLRGSYFFIGSLITTLELPPDAPAENHCGTCSLCIEACPTQAIVNPFELDSRLCLSYQTIENHTEAPPELRNQYENWLFGCDICQEVCPFNKPDRMEGDPELAPREENQNLKLESLIDLESETAFRERFPQSPIKRTKFRGILRNAIYILGSQDNEEAKRLLKKIEQRTDIDYPEVKEALEWARVVGSPREPG